MSRRGFTIVEIMVAVLILATSLAAIFGAQFAAVASSVYARNLTTAVQLGRCKMSELELSFIEEGFQEGTVEERGACCAFLDDKRNESFTCTWKVEPVELPDAQQLLSGAADSDAQGAFLSSMGVDSDAAGGALGVDPLGDMGLGVLSDMLPVVTSLIQQAIRRVTVTVQWKEGSGERDMQLVQYVTHPSQGPLKLLQDAAAAQDALEDLGVVEGEGR